ncbi:hypothetical protein M5C90_24215 [Pseudomonas chlororaphis subsp. piscium]|nr:hypothetical protein M5C90_24215 [Pseudomonas chlororaphis subsp. piscium]
MKRRKTTPLNPIEQAARQLNEQHERFGASFYGDGKFGGRWFQARIIDRAVLEVMDWDHWTPVPDGTAFHDHNGRPILTVTYPPQEASAELLPG